MLANDPRPSWGGFMSKVHRRTSSVQHIMLSSHYHSNMDPSKLSTMYTCIVLAAEQLKKCGLYCITIKFDIPLEKDKRDGSG